MTWLLGFPGMRRYFAALLALVLALPPQLRPAYATDTIASTPPITFDGSYFERANGKIGLKLPDARYNQHAGNFASPTDYDPLCDGSSPAHACQTAINTAAAVLRNSKFVDVQLDAGTYYVTGAINIGGGTSGGQRLRGSGRGTTTISVDQSFDSAASGVIVMTGREQNSPTVRDLTISFAQPLDQTSRANFLTLAQSCTSSAGGTGCKYPPAIYTNTTNRFRIERVRISSAWDGISATASAGGFLIDDVEMGAFNKGLDLGGGQDVGHIAHYHFWNFGFASTDGIWSVFTDGSTYCGQIGEVDGLVAIDVLCFRGRLALTSAFTWGMFTNLEMDGNDATFEVAATTNPGLQVNGFYGTGATNGTTNTHCKIDIASLNVTTIIHNASMQGPGSGSIAQLCVAGGTVIMDGSLFQSNTAGASHVSQTGGTLVMTGNLLTMAGAATVPAIVASGGTALQAVGNNFVPGANATAPTVHTTNTPTFFVGNQFPATGTNVGGLTIDTDNAANYVADNNFKQWNASVPSGVLGYYDLGDQALSLTITPAFATQGDFSPANNVTVGAYFRRGNWVDFHFDETFDTNAYTTAGGVFKLNHNMPTAYSTGHQSCAIGALSQVVSAVPVYCTLPQGGAAVQFTKFNTGAAATTIDINGVPPSKTGVNFRVSGRYRVR